MSLNPEESVTAYKQYRPQKQTQTLPGLDKDMAPFAEHTKLEKWDENGKPYLEEYKGSEKLKNKKVLITGGDSGIGRAVAICMAREGADISINYLPAEQIDADDVKKAIEAEGRKCHLIPLDLQGKGNTEKIVQEHLQAHGRLDVLVNNASKQIQCKDLADIDIDNVQSTFESNIIAMIALTKYALPHLRRGSTIVNSSSVTAYKGSAGMVDYSSTKGAILAFTRSLAAQVMPKGIRVNAICPGPVFTPLQPASRSEDQMDEWGVGDIPLHGRVGQPIEQAPAYIFAASADSNCMTGSSIHVNSGQWMGS